MSGTVLIPLIRGNLSDATVRRDRAESSQCHLVPTSTNEFSGWNEGRGAPELLARPVDLCATMPLPRRARAGNTSGCSIRLIV